MGERILYFDAMAAGGCLLCGGPDRGRDWMYAHGDCWDAISTDEKFSILVTIDSRKSKPRQINGIVPHCGHNGCNYAAGHVGPHSYDDELAKAKKRIAELEGARSEYVENLQARAWDAEQRSGNLAAVANDAFRHLAGLVVTDQPIDVQRQHREVTRALGAALAKLRGIDFGK